MKYMDIEKCLKSAAVQVDGKCVEFGLIVWPVQVGSRKSCATNLQQIEPMAF